MNRIIKKIIYLAAVLTAVFCLPFPSIAAEYSRTAEYLIKAVPEPASASVGGEWTVIGLSGCTEGVHREYFDRYYKNLEALLKQNCGVMSEDSYTEYSRAVLALSAIGRSALSVAGYNLVTPICDYDKVTEQGLNGAIYALIALDKGGYVGPRKEYRDYILGKELPGGGWSYSGKGDADPDMTAMAVEALSRYRLYEDVSPALSRAMDVLNEAEYDSCETLSQIIIAQSEMGEAPDEALKKRLLELRLPDGSFKHCSDDEEGNLMSTEQALMALNRF